MNELEDDLRLNSSSKSKAIPTPKRAGAGKRRRLKPKDKGAAVIRGKSTSPKSIKKEQQKEVQTAAYSAESPFSRIFSSSVDERESSPPSESPALLGFPPSSESDGEVPMQEREPTPLNDSFPLTFLELFEHLEALPIDGSVGPMVELFFRLNVLAKQNFPLEINAALRAELMNWYEVQKKTGLVLKELSDALRDVHAGSGLRQAAVEIAREELCLSALMLDSPSLEDLDVSLTNMNSRFSTKAGGTDENKKVAADGYLNLCTAITDHFRNLDLLKVIECPEKLVIARKNYSEEVNKYSKRDFQWQNDFSRIKLLLIFPQFMDVIIGDLLEVENFDIERMQRMSQMFKQVEFTSLSTFCQITKKELVGRVERLKLIFLAIERLVESFKEVHPSSLRENFTFLNNQISFIAVCGENKRPIYQLGLEIFAQENEKFFEKKETEEQSGFFERLKKPFRKKEEKVSFLNARRDAVEHSLAARRGLMPFFHSFEAKTTVEEDVNRPILDALCKKVGIKLPVSGQGFRRG